MRIGFVGLGKLGTPTALWTASRGHEVLGYDPVLTPLDEPLEGLPDGTMIRRVDSPDDLAACELVFVCVQTPHGAKFDGTHLLTDAREDFDYRYLHRALDAIPARPEVAVISTVLPGTYRREFAPRPLAYTPSFCAMGTVIADLDDPEFVLLGTDTPHPALERFHRDTPAPILRTDITTAEGIKVLYNTFITAKVTLANLYGELSERIGMDADAITTALSLGFRRITSPAYLSAGMGDGGPCHPRDNIALSWLARETSLSFDLFGALMEAREAHARWLASLIPDGAVLYGRSYKPGSALEDGSPALLLARILEASGKDFAWYAGEPGMFNVITCRDLAYRDITWPEGSTVLDPFGIIAGQDGVTVRRIGRR